MHKRKVPPTCVIALRCSPEQRAELARRAAGQQLGSYLRAALFPANDNAPLPKRRRQATKDDLALTKALLLLGQIAMHIRDQARAAELAGTSPEDDRHAEGIERQLAEIKALLMKGLGIRER